MDLSKVRLVVSDMDGTLLNSKGYVSSLFFELFEKLQEHNIQFVAASGRQYHSIAKVLQPIKDKIFIIGENGGIAKQSNQLLTLKTLDPTKIAEIIPLLRTIAKYIILCGKDSAYIETKDEDFIKKFQEYYTGYKIVEDLTKAVHDTDFLKIAVFHTESSEGKLYPKVKHLENDFLLKISGQNWLDISNLNVNKGNTLKIVQEKLNISKEETLVFGDYHNDIEMLQEAHFSFAMKNAHAEVKKIARFETESNDNFGVEKVLEQLIKAKSISN